MTALADLVGKLVLEKGTRTVGRVLKIHAAGEYISPVNDRPVLVPVLEMEGGASFTAANAEEKFEVVSDAALKLHSVAEGVVAEAVKMLGGVAQAGAVDADEAAAVVAGVLIEQGRALARGKK